MKMLISQILRTKRPDVVILAPDATIRSAIDLMTREHVGALVVVDEEQHLLGVVSERDIIQNLDFEGADPMGARHVPVVEYGRPIGIVSLGDVVKSRLDETIQENSVLQDIARNHWLVS